MSLLNSGQSLRRAGTLAFIWHDVLEPLGWPSAVLSRRAMWQAVAHVARSPLGANDSCRSVKQPMSMGSPMLTRCSTNASHIIVVACVFSISTFPDWDSVALLDWFWSTVCDQSNMGLLDCNHEPKNVGPAQQTRDVSPANTRRWPNAALLLADRRRRWANSNPALG